MHTTHTGLPTFTVTVTRYVLRCGCVLPVTTTAFCRLLPVTTDLRLHRYPFYRVTVYLRWLRLVMRLRGCTLHTHTPRWFCGCVTAYRARLRHTHFARTVGSRSLRSVAVTRGYTGYATAVPRCITHVYTQFTTVTVRLVTVYCHTPHYIYRIRFGLYSCGSLRLRLVRLRFTVVGYILPTVGSGSGLVPLHTTVGLVTRLPAVTPTHAVTLCCRAAVRLRFVGFARTVTHYAVCVYGLFVLRFLHHHFTFVWFVTHATPAVHYRLRCYLRFACSLLPFCRLGCRITWLRLLRGYRCYGYRFGSYAAPVRYGCYTVRISSMPAYHVTIFWLLPARLPFALPPAVTITAYVLRVLPTVYTRVRITVVAVHTWDYRLYFTVRLRYRVRYILRHGCTTQARLLHHRWIAVLGYGCLPLHVTTHTVPHTTHVYTCDLPYILRLPARAPRVTRRGLLLRLPRLLHTVLPFGLVTRLLHARLRTHRLTVCTRVYGYGWFTVYHYYVPRLRLVVVWLP